MVDTVRFLDLWHTTIKVEPEGWVMPYPSSTWHQERVTQWEDGRTDEWDREKLIYDNYLDILFYDARLTQFYGDTAQCQVDFENCEIVTFDDNILCEAEHLACVAGLTKPVVPEGYYTQEQADTSVLLHSEWVSDKADWEADPANIGLEYPVTEPQILLIPADLPVVQEPAALIPNTIDAYDPLFGQSLEQVKETKYIEIWGYADDVKYAAESTFFAKGSASHRNSDRLLKKHAKIANKKFKSQTLTPDEETFDDDYDQLLDYQDSVNDTADLAQDAVELLTDKYAVAVYDAEIDPVWPVWAVT